MLKLLLANLKMTFRNKQALFWTLLFPCMFIIIFGLFNFEEMGNAKYALIDKANSDISKQFKEGFGQIEFFEVDEEITDKDSAEKKLKDGDINFTIILPADFKIESKAPENLSQESIPTEQKTATEASKIGTVEIYYDQSNISLNQIIFSVVEKFLDKMNMEIVEAPSMFTYKAEAIQSKNIKYIDILVPGILGMAVMTAALYGISGEITRYREQKLLKRLQATPLKVRNFLSAHVLSYLILNIIQITLILLIAKIFFDVNVYGSYFLIYALCILGSLIFLNIGFAIAGYAKSTNSAEALSQVISLPMMFLSGVFFSTEALPSAVAKVVDYLPLTPLIEALRRVSIDEMGLFDVWPQVLFMLAWIVISFLFAWRMFSFSR